MAAVGSAKRPFTLVVNSADRLGSSGSNGSTSSYTVKLDGMPVFDTTSEAPKFYALKMTSFATKYTAGSYAAATSTGFLAVAVSVPTPYAFRTSAAGGRVSFIVPLTTTGQVDQAGFPQDPVIITADIHNQLQIQIFADGSTTAATVTEHTIVFTATPLYD